ncbi:dienelactone hydrolase family protein [Klebsiella pneumoniae]
MHSHDQQTDFNSLLPNSGTMTRRGFVTTMAVAGFALAAQPVQAQSVISTSDEGLDTGDTSIASHDGKMLPLYYARPAGTEALPVVLVVSEIFGVHEYIRDTARRLAHAGYLAIAPELFFREGDPRQIESVGEIIQNIVSRVPDAQVMLDLDHCAAWSATQGGDPSRLGITGFCWGGRITWLYAAHNPQLKAGVAWYGRLDGLPSERQPQHPIDIAADLHAPVLGLYGDQDQGIPVEDVEAMLADLAHAGKNSEIVLYPDAPHAFHADYRPSYREDAAQDGWKRLLDWFGRHL